MPPVLEGSNNVRKLSPCDVEALQKCLKENMGDMKKVSAEQHDNWSNPYED
jgi:hypothetical protein